LLALAPAVVVQAISNPLPIYLGLSATESEISKSKFCEEEIQLLLYLVVQSSGCPDSDP
jgi:hypothetical protein